MSRFEKIHEIVMSWCLCALSVSAIYLMVCADTTWLRVTLCFLAGLPMTAAMLKIGTLITRLAKNDVEKE